uniref:Uncharacterized protein n=1 Tax=Physcomitrium patens TaxID=3218 RepID=A0A2K1IG11_PHYPA|nr:hypothetical protein PHYPA_028807 [Physcomitrium patens]
MHFLTAVQISAQMVERLFYNQEATVSMPVFSMSYNPNSINRNLASENRVL